MARRPFYGQGGAIPIARMNMQAATAPGRAYAQMGKDFGEKIGSAIKKYAQNKKEGEAADMQIGAILQNMTPERQQDIESGEGELGKSLSKFIDGELPNSKKKALLGSLMTVNTADQLKRKEQMDAQRFLQQQELTKLNMQIAKQNLARQESADQLAGEEQEKTTNFLNFLAQPGPDQIDPSGLDRNSVLRNIQAGKGATPPARMIPGPSLAEQSVMSPQAKQFIRRAIQQNQPIDKVLPMAKQIDQEIAQSQPKAPNPFEAKKYFDESINKMRKEYNSLDEVKAFKPVRAAFLKVKQSAEKPSAAGDLALVFNYMKILDPGSVVREGEFRTAADATAWLQKSEADGVAIPAPIAQAIRKLKDGTILTDAQRKDFVNIARKAASAQFAPVKDSYLQYRNIVNQMQLPEGLTLPDNYQMIEDELAGPIPIQSSSNAITTDQGDYSIQGLSVEAQ